MAWIYALCDPDTDAVRYVGKAKNPTARFKSHKNEKRTTRKCRWFASLAREGKKPVIRPLEEVPDDDWQPAEVKWIAYFRADGCDLTNHTDGGEGLNGIDEEARARMSEVRKKLWQDPVWREAAMEKMRSPERRKNISVSLAGKKKSKEHVAKLPQNQVGFKHGADFCRKISEAGRGRKLKPEHIEKMRLRSRGNSYGIGNRSRKGQTQQPAERLKKSIAERHPKTEEHRERIREGQRRLWAARRAAGTATMTHPKIHWPSIEWVREQLATRTTKEVAAILGVKPGTLSGFIHRHRNIPAKGEDHEQAREACFDQGDAANGGDSWQEDVR